MPLFISGNMEIKVPAGCDIKVEGNLVVATMSGESHKFPFNSRKVKVEVAGDLVKITPIKKLRRETHAVINSMAKHLGNVFKGDLAPYIKNLQVVYAHFPISIEVKGARVTIKNFLGEKLPRQADIVGKVQVSVSGQDIVVKGASKDAVGQTAANIIQSVKITGKDRRVFQDGIYQVK